MPDAPAIYLCVPSEENLRRICQDLAENVYDAYYFNFLAPISRQRLEDLATASLRANCAANVKKVGGAAGNASGSLLCDTASRLKGRNARNYA